MTIGPRNPKPSSHTSATLFIYRYHHDKDACRNGFVSRRYDQCFGRSKTLSLRHDYMKATYNHILGIYDSTANTPNDSLWLSTSFSLPSCGGLTGCKDMAKKATGVIFPSFAPRSSSSKVTQLDFAESFLRQTGQNEPARNCAFSFQMVLAWVCREYHYKPSLARRCAAYPMLSISKPWPK
jgi:hypothetical protein